MIRRSQALYLSLRGAAAGIPQDLPLVWMDSCDVARLLGVGVLKVDEWVATGVLRHTGGMINPEDVETLLYGRDCPCPDD